jgi:aspartyl-tRNA(Asn)/glutamyl-tRNA(Gln) amidotransferase subunit C
MKLSREEVQRISQLVRLGLDEAEIEQFRLQLSDILENMEILKQVDTSNVPPTAQSVNLQNVFRPDEAIDSCPVDQILANAPQSINNFIKVKAVLEE